MKEHMRDADRLVAAMIDGPARAIAVAFVEWGSPGTPATVTLFGTGFTTTEPAAIRAQ